MEQAPRSVGRGVFPLLPAVTTQRMGCTEPVATGTRDTANPGEALATP